MNKIIEIRSYNLKPGTRKDFHKLFLEQALPLLKKWNIEVMAFGPSIHDEDSYFLVRAYKNLSERQQKEDAFYGSEEWKKGPREAILAQIINYTTIVVSIDSFPVNFIPQNIGSNEGVDKEQLSILNAQFIKNFISGDTVAHNEIIHKDFLCIENSGAIVNRDEYLKEWAHSYKDGRFTSFTYTDEYIRLFGNAALIRSKTVYTKNINGKTITGNTVYTDTYIKENGRWWCVQAQITPVITH
ncbi:MAG TPA: DUF4440 domain-containing protein [Chitinophagaceae bacterium]|jgi:hypothetical protein|nr:DUF4440 domain-containing protein [Chitinophagaceae bacterium]